MTKHRDGDRDGDGDGETRVVVQETRCKEAEKETLRGKYEGMMCTKLDGVAAMNDAHASVLACIASDLCEKSQTDALHKYQS